MMPFWQYTNKKWTKSVGVFQIYLFLSISIEYKDFLQNREKSEKILMRPGNDHIRRLPTDFYVLTYQYEFIIYKVLTTPSFVWRRWKKMREEKKRLTFIRSLYIPNFFYVIVEKDEIILHHFHTLFEYFLSFFICLQCVALPTEGT